jgi:phytoene desaturase
MAVRDRRCPLQGGKMTQHVIIIGAGIGGLATANLLAKAGYSVDVFEKEPAPGGRAGQLIQDGFTFDTGPSWYLMPEVFAHYYELLGESVDTALELQRLDPGYKVFFETEPPVTITSNLTKDAATFESIEPGAGKALERYVKQSDNIYQLSLRHFLYSNFVSLSDFVKRDVLKHSLTMLRMAFTSIDRYVSRFVTDRRLRQILEYPMVFLGTSPFSAPAIYSLMSALDFKEGVFYPRGGIYTIIESLVEIGKKNGVQYHFNAPVAKISVTAGKATGIQLQDGSVQPADIVISNADLHFTETKLLNMRDQTYPDTYWQNKEASPSALLLYLGVKGKLPEFEHHNLLFVDDWAGNFAAIYDTKTAPEKASIYICKPSQSDPSVAHPGDENIFVLVPLPAGIELNSSQTDQLTAQYLEQIKIMTGVNLASRTISSATFGPNDFATKYYSWQSSMLGQSHKLTQSAFFRTRNKNKKVKNLFYVGGNTMPGIGLPMCLISAELIYKRLAGDKRGGPVSHIQQLAEMDDA